MTTRQPIKTVIASRKRLLERLKAARKKVLEDYDAQIQAEETFLRELEKMAAKPEVKG